MTLSSHGSTQDTPDSRFRAVLLLVVFLVAFVPASGLILNGCQDDCCVETSSAGDHTCVAFCCGGLIVTIQTTFRLPELTGSGCPSMPSVETPPTGTLKPPYRPPAIA